VQLSISRAEALCREFLLGFNLEEVGQLLRLEDGTHCSEAAGLAALRLTDVRVRLANLMRMEAALSKLVGECNAQSDEVSCPLISALHCCQQDSATPAGHGVCKAAES
jgi:MerR family mercuric resistance operon transcriptional regulator